MYYIMDPKLIELGLMPSLDVGKTVYDSQIRNGLQLQLRRVKLGDDIEEAHMRNLQLIAAWAYETGLEDNVIEKIEKDGKHYFVISDYEALRGIFADQLREIQRIKSEGDFEAGQHLIETYGVKVDQAMHEEVLARVKPLNIAPYKGFIQPRLVAVEENGEIVDVKIEPMVNFVDWMLESEQKYSFLPVTN
jgi:dipeptidyl-peptidase-3